MKSVNAIIIVFVCLISSCQFESDDSGIPDANPTQSGVQKDDHQPASPGGPPIGIIHSKNNGQVESDAFLIAPNGDTLDSKRTVNGDAFFDYFKYGTVLVHSQQDGFDPFPSIKTVVTSSKNPNPLVTHDLIEE